MIGDLPELGDIFDDSHKFSEHSIDTSLDSCQSISTYISRDGSRWMIADFVDIAVAGIGLHLLLPLDLELTAQELNNLSIRFVKKMGGKSMVLKETRVMVRWQERDPKSGKLKLGIHFHGELKEDIVIKEILEFLEIHNK